MYPFARFGILYCCSKAKRYHGIGDESHKDGASVFLTGVRADFDTANGTETANALIDVKLVLNQVFTFLGGASARLSYEHLC